MMMFCPSCGRVPCFCVHVTIRDMTLDALERELCAELKDWCRAEGLSYRSADDLRSDDITTEQRSWLEGYCSRWAAWEDMKSYQ